MFRKATLLGIAAVALLALPAQADPPSAWLVHCQIGDEERAFPAFTPQEIRVAIAACREAGGHPTGVTVIN